MINKPVSDYIFLGTSLRFIQDCQIGWTINGHGYITYNIDQFLDELEVLNLVVTKRASSKLIEINDSFKTLGDEAKLNKDQSKDLTEAINILRGTMLAEASGIIALIITDKKYSIEKLQNMRALLDKDIYDKLPELARFDLDECGLCICFERPTAAAFHLLRASEEVLKQFHKVYIRKKYTTFKNWGNYTNELRNKPSGKKPDITILNHLDNIKNSFRNPTQHPDKVYDIEEVQNLLGVCLDVINRMAKHF